MKYTPKNIGHRVLSALSVDKVKTEAVPVPHDDPIDVIPGPNPPGVPAEDADPISDEQEFEEEHDSYTSGKGADYGAEDEGAIPADGPTEMPTDRNAVAEYSKKTSDVTGKPALDAEELDGINSLLGTASFSFDGKSYNVVRLDGSWYIKDEQEDGNGSSGGSSGDSDSVADERPAEDQKSGEEPRVGDEKDQEKKAVKHEPPKKEPVEPKEKHQAPSQKKNESHEVEAPQTAMRILSALGKDFYGQPEDAEMTGVGTGMTEESITPDIAPGFVVTRDRLTPGEAETEGHEDPSQTGTNAPSMARKAEASPMALENMQRGKPTDYDEAAADRGEMMLNTIEDTSQFLKQVTRVEFKKTGYFTRISKDPIPKDRLPLMDRVLKVDKFRRKGKMWVKPIDHIGIDQAVSLRNDGRLEVTTASNDKVLSESAALVLRAMAMREIARLEESLTPAEKQSVAEACALLAAHFKEAKE